jgi:SAM-dependent methyltransferase
MADLNREQKDQALFDRISQQYAEKDVYPPSQYARRFLFHSLFDLLYDRTGVKPRVLFDIGCGVGAAADYLRGTYDRYVGVDYAKELIEIGRQRYPWPEVELYSDNAKALQLPGFSPDFVFGNGVLHHVDDLTSLMQTLKDLGNDDTYYGFIEPQSGNPLIQMMRWVRKQVDPAYSEDQVFFTREGLRKLFVDHGFEVVEVWHQGYFTTPIAQVMLKPEALFLPYAKLAARIDRRIQQRVSSPLAWNLLIIAKKAR